MDSFQGDKLWDPILVRRSHFFLLLRLSSSAYTSFCGLGQRACQMFEQFCCHTSLRTINSSFAKLEVLGTVISLQIPIAAPQGQFSFWPALFPLVFLLGPKTLLNECLYMLGCVYTANFCRMCNPKRIQNLSSILNFTHSSIIDLHFKL